jgi:paraquat-inducible protein A
MENHQHHVHCMACPSCDTTVEIPEDRHGMQVRCPVCGALLVPARRPQAFNVALVAVSALALLFWIAVEPFMTVSAAGVKASMSLADTVVVLWSGFKILLAFFLCFAVIFPNYVLCVICLIGFFNFKPGIVTAKLYSFCHRFAMVDVFVLAVAVSLVKLLQLADVAFHVGFVLMLVFSCLFIWCWMSFRPSRVWNLYKQQEPVEAVPSGRAMEQGIAICPVCGCQHRPEETGGRCPRCGAASSYRKVMWKQRTSALVIAAAIMFLPANLYPIMVTTYIGSATGSNIVDGVVSLWGMGSWFVAMVVVTASLFIPVFKIISLCYLLAKVTVIGVFKPRAMGTLFRIVELIGKWSMIDVFVVIIMSATVRMGGLLTIDPGFAIVAFCLVVMVTMFAASSFDERLIWDRFRSEAAEGSNGGLPDGVRQS